MKKIFTILFLITIVINPLFSQLENGKYTYANDEITLNFTISEDGWIISTILTNNLTKKSINGSGEFREQNDLAWYEFQIAQCNYSFDIPKNNLILSKYDCKSGEKNKDFNLTKKNISGVIKSQIINENEEDNLGQGGPEGEIVIAISDKVYFYKESNLNSKTSAYFVKGQKAEYYEVSDDDPDDGFLYVNFSYKGKVTSGYILKKDVKFE